MPFFPSKAIKFHHNFPDQKSKGTNKQIQHPVQQSERYDKRVLQEIC